MATWNVSSILKRGGGLALSVPGGYELSDKGRAKLAEMGLGVNIPQSQPAMDLRQHLNNIVDADTRAFVLEAIQCYEAGLHRSAVVMSWIAAMDVLHKEVVRDHLHAFNAEAKRVEPRWKAASTPDDLGRMKEGDFLDRISAISLVGKNVKAELVKALNLRNGCGHPNSLKISSNVVAAHLETLLLNVFDQFHA